MVAQRELDRAVIQPRQVYADPEDVLADSRLSDAQKRRVLESWERDAREMAVAEEESMGGGEPSRLSDVLAALAALPAEGERRRGPSTKHGSQAAPSSTTSSPPSAPAMPTQSETVRAPSADEAPQGTRLTGQEARQGEIILRSPARRAIFIGGIVLVAIVCVFLFYQATI